MYRIVKHPNGNVYLFTIDEFGKTAIFVCFVQLSDNTLDIVEIDQSKGLSEWEKKEQDILMEPFYPSQEFLDSCSDYDDEYLYDNSSEE